MFCNFCEKNLKIQNAAIFGETIFFLKIGIVTLQRYLFGSKISSKSLYLVQFLRHKHFCVLQFLRKIQNGRHSWRDKIFLKIGIATLGGQKFRRNGSISHSFRDISIFVFSLFGKFIMIN